MAKRKPAAELTQAQKQGRSAVKGGNDFERALDKFHHEYYAPSGYAWLERHHMPTAPAPMKSPSGKFMMLRRVTGAAPYDFSGVMGWASPQKGRAVIVEAKRTEKRATGLPIKEDYGGIRPSQIRALVEAYMTFGALSVLLWRNEDCIGILHPKKLSAIMGAFEAGNINRIGRERFFWLEPGILDYLPVVLEHEGISQKAV